MTTKLQAAARAVIERWDSPLWKDLPATGESIAALRDALAREEAHAVEPVAWLHRDGVETWVSNGPSGSPSPEPLFTRPNPPPSSNPTLSNSTELKSGDREALLSRMPQLNYNNHSQGEVEDLITWANEAFDMLAANQIDALTAERYNWLCDQHWAFDTLVVTTPDNVVIHSLCPSLSSLDMTIDAAIDAEIKAAKKVSGA